MKRFRSSKMFLAGRGGAVLAVILLGSLPLAAGARMLPGPAPDTVLEMAQAGGQAPAGLDAASEGLPADNTTAGPVDDDATGALVLENEADLELTDEATDAVGWGRRETLLASLTIFVLAVFLGFELITKVPPTLHTPLMSGSNAISGITLVGAIIAAGVKAESVVIPIIAALAVVMATVNVVGGFAVTHRMLSMFRRK